MWQIWLVIAHFSDRLMPALGSVACGMNRLLSWTRAAIASLCLLLTVKFMNGYKMALKFYKCSEEICATKQKGA